MATPTNITLLSPFVTVEVGIAEGEIDIDTFDIDGRGQIGIVRAIYSGCTRVTVDDKIFFVSDSATWMKQDIDGAPTKFFNVDEMDIVFKSTFVIEV